jgi:serine/threonine protein phosphatase 1
MTAVLTYAIGDIHGSYTKLRNLLKHCAAHCGGRPYRMVFIGDYIDRGRRSREVVELLMQTQAASPDAIVCLKGNHEDMLDAAARYGGQDEVQWLFNGGDATLDSYRVGTAAEIPAAHLDWLAARPLATADERRFYVHAGVRPGVPLQQQREEDALWIREPFLSDRSDHGLLVVHGHTPTPSRRAELFPNRLNLDSGACFGGPLTAAVFEDKPRGPKAFITDDGNVTPAPALTDLEWA